jgi:hypothetical protein
MQMKNRMLKPFFILFGMGIILACSITFTPRARGGEIDEGVERFTIPGTDQKVSYQISEEGEAIFWLEDQPDLEPLTSRVISEERGSLEWNGARLDGYGELDGEQSAVLAEMFDSPYGQAVPLIALENACRSDNNLTAQQLAALLYPWQMHLKYSPVDRVEEARRMWDASGCADAFNQPPEEMDEDTPILIYSGDAPIPVVFGYFPFDPEGAFELEEPSPTGISIHSDILLANFSERIRLIESKSAKPAQLESVWPGGEYVRDRLDQHGPCGARCRGACGGLTDSCPLTNCTHQKTLICEPDEDGNNTGMVKEIDRFECGVHPGCIEHDACYDECNEMYECKSWKAAYCRHSGSYILGHYGCDVKAREQYGTRQCSAWAIGYGGSQGFTERQVWFYTPRDGDFYYIRDEKDCPVEVVPTRFTMIIEYEEMGFFYESGCRPGKGRLIMTIWNVGAAGGDEYAVVDISQSLFPVFVKHEDRCVVTDYHALPEEVFVLSTVFSGGPNGVITVTDEILGEFVLGRFMDGNVFVFDDVSVPGFSPRTFPVPNPSVFTGLK